MPRYIDADALIRRICGMKCGCERYECGYDEAGCPKVRDLETAPTVSPDEVRGVWKIGGYGQFSDAEEKWYDGFLQGGFFYCSVCKKRASLKSNYCPNCGARMGGVQDALS